MIFEIKRDDTLPHSSSTTFLQLGIGDPGVLEGIGGILVPELPLHGGDIAGLVHDMPAHRVAGGVGGLALHVRPAAGLVPDAVVTFTVRRPELLTTVSAGRKSAGERGTFRRRCRAP